ncbi:MAG: CoA transferase [Pseudonocardiales bacterium]|nr:CoA transferase [Pseudonocardiales bacterium]
MLLEGVKVVEMSTWVAGPGAAAVMADWGADVIKVEAPIGDAMRGFAPDTEQSPGNPIFINENRGKRGIVLDLKQPGSRDVLLRLLEQADVFITNVRPGSLAGMGLDYGSLKAQMPHLIYAAITGYGLVGPDADLPAFDITAFWTASGVARATIPEGVEPFPVRPGFGDHVTAISAVAGILAALHERTQTGAGRLVESSLIRAGTYAIGWDMSSQLRYGGAVTTNKPRGQRDNATSGYFRTADDRWVIALARSKGDYFAILEAIGLAELGTDPRFIPPVTDQANLALLRGLVDEAFARLTLAEARERLRKGDVIHATLQTLGEAAESAVSNDAGCFVDVEDGWGGTFRTIAAPIRFPDGAPFVGRAAPKLGQHTAEVLDAVGYTEAQIAELLSTGAVRGPA